MRRLHLATLEIKEALEVAGYGEFNFKHGGLISPVMIRNPQMTAKEKKVCGIIS